MGPPWKLPGPPKRPMPSRPSSAVACPSAKPPPPATRAMPTAPPARASLPRLRGCGAGAYAGTGAVGCATAGGAGCPGVGSGVGWGVGCSHLEPLAGGVSSLLMEEACAPALSADVAQPVNHLWVGPRSGDVGFHGGDELTLDLAPGLVAHRATPVGRAAHVASGQPALGEQVPADGADLLGLAVDERVDASGREGERRDRVDEKGRVLVGVAASVQPLQIQVGGRG